MAQAALLGALVLLVESFGRDVWWLRTHRQSNLAAVTVGPKRGPLRTAIGVALTILAAVLVWAALVAPDQPQALTPAAFMRVPLEGLVVIALAVVLPRTARRVVAAVLGPALALLVILKILDIAFFKAFTRPFDLIGDAGNAGVGIETLRAAIGRTEANLIVYGGLAIAIALLVFMTLAAFRLTRVAADHPRWSLRAVAAIGGVWLVCSAFGAQFISHTPIASTSAAGFVIHEAHAVQADIHDQGVFAGQIKHDRFRSTPGNQLLTALRGKDVLLTFVESYGQVTVQGSSFSPAVDALLDRGTSQLKTAGFSARSAFLTSPTFGGVSWLAHSSLQAGVWANSQRRYNQLVSTDRFTLSDAFKRAGWRTINDAPADDRGWEEGTSFYHYDKLYDRRDVGYRGPGYTYAPMPDQYMFSALQRLELAKTNRPPVFAEVDTVSSHMPWNRIPEMVPWAQVGDGSIFNRTPTHHWTGAFWSNPTRVKAAYAQAIEYSLNTLISFVQHYGKKNLVLIVVGDEQPLPNVSGQGANYDVPISIISHDPAVQKQIAGWGWQDGLRPAPQAPVWRMSAFRDRFLAAFGSGR
jgi:phosphoglycerol transferase MdoB-like AlkP superfamily enzyme